MYFASLGLDSLGADIAPTAIEIANRSVIYTSLPSLFLKNSCRDLMSKEKSLAEKAKFELIDFFTLKVSEEELFDLVYDYRYVVHIKIP